jgi:GNAT superfamily N-acetyltransferase
LAAYERLADQVTADEAAIDDALFANSPKAFCDIAEWDGEPVGFALWFLNFSTFRGRSGLYIEDLFVRPAHRSRGVGGALLQNLAERCLAQGWARLEWAVLDWNEPAIDFYEAQGAKLLHDWRICRVSGEALRRLGGGDRH